MAVQNIDFAKKLNYTESSQPPKRKKNKGISWYIILFFLGYAMGIYSGIQLYQLKHIEENLIKHPDTLNQNLNSQTKSSRKTKNTVIYSNVVQQEGNYIIFLGNMNPKRSSEIIKFLKRKQIIQKIPLHICTGLESYQMMGNQTQGGIFRIPLKDGSIHKIFLGCFLAEEDAIRALKQLQKLKNLNFQDAEVIQIEYD